jgi:hypothetical protein
MGEDAITQSDRKIVKVDVFEDADLLSEEEKAAMADDSDEAAEEAKAQAEQARLDDEAAAKKADEEAAKKGQEALDEKDKKVAEADAAIEAQKKADSEKAAKDAAAQAEADKKAADDGEDGSEDGANAGAEVSVPTTPPPVTMNVMSPEQVQEVKDGLVDAKKRFEDGEIDYDNYFEERLALERKLWANDIASQISSDGVENQWQWEQETFMNAAENSWIADDDVVYSAFAATVNNIMSTEEGAVMPGPQLLATAKERVAARFSPTLQQDAEAAAEDKAKKEAIKRAKKGQANKPIPDTLADIPAAEQDEGPGEFAYLDKLDGEAYEKAVEALSEAQLKRYENSI